MTHQISKLLLSIIKFFDNRGERPPLQQDFENINSDLQFAYQYAAAKSRHKSILDYGCGGGYGTEYLSRFTNQPVFGFDIDRLSITTARDYFHHHPNLFFVTKLPNKKQFDLIVSFQVIEHLNPPQLRIYFKNLHQLLKPNGTVIIATPNQNITSYRLKTPVFAFHYQEFNPGQLKKILNQHFSTVKIFGQISQPMLQLVKQHLFSYSDVSKYPLKTRIIRWLSQIKPIRFLISKTPQSLKDFLLGQTKRIDTPQVLVTSPKLIANSYILLAVCQN